MIQKSNFEAFLQQHESTRTQSTEESRYVSTRRFHLKIDIDWSGFVDSSNWKEDDGSWKKVIYERNQLEMVTVKKLKTSLNEVDERIATLRTWEEEVIEGYQT